MHPEILNENQKSINSQKKIVLFLMLCIFIIIGIYLWYINREVKGYAEDYEIMYSSGEIIVENKRAGVSFKAPSGWEAGIFEGIEGSVIFVLPGTKGDDETYGLNSETPLSEGCLIESTVAHNRRVDFEKVQKDLEEFRYVFSGADSCDFEMSEVNGIKYLRNYYTSPYVGPGIGAHFISNNNVYSFCLCLPLDENEKQKNQCINDFYEFLETIVIEDKFFSF